MKEYLVFFRMVEGQNESQREIWGDSNMAHKSVVWGGSLRHTDATLRGTQ